MRRKIAILFGGCSSEYPISLQSATAVIRNLNLTQVEPILVGITRNGEWFRYTGSVEGIEQDTWLASGQVQKAIISPDRVVHGLIEFGPEGLEVIQLDAAFPIFHGKNGEDGTIQGLLELAGIPIVGCGLLSSALAMDKHLAHLVVRAAGIETPRHWVIRDLEELPELESKLLELGYPLFVKPVRSGSSHGISCVKSPEMLRSAVQAAFAHDQRVILEERIVGFEVGCAVLGNQELTLGLVDEIELQGAVFDYREKYTLETAKIHLPARISPAIAAEVQNTAKVIYRALGCQGFARVDLFLTPNQKIIFNEVNTIPGFTEHSRYPGMLQGTGWSFPQILDRVIGLAVGR